MRALAFPIALAALAAALSIVPVAAQVSAQKLSGTYVPPRPRYAMLTVRYALVGQTKMTLTTPAGSFTCTPPGGIQVGLPMMTCTLAVPRGSTVALRANYLIFGSVAQVGNGKAMTGKQWQGACAGTGGDTCALAMSEDRIVQISPYAAP